MKVLFVCLGNICRSPLAEGIFDHLVEQHGLSHKIQSDSAGTGAYHIGNLPDERTRTVAANHGVKIDHRARQLSKNDFDEFDYIIAMDLSNKTNIRNVARGNKAYLDKIVLMRDYDNDRPDLEVPDPYYDGIEKFEEVYKILLKSNEGFLKWLLNKHKEL